MEQNNYFLFESDFVEDNIRCIPMVVRMKLDMVGIKMSLAAWSRCSPADRKALAIAPCNTANQKWLFGIHVENLIRSTGEQPVFIQGEQKLFWENLTEVPEKLVRQAALYDWIITSAKWKALTPLQRFALVKLCRPGHENLNFPLAMKEFGLTEQLPENVGA